jgi:hypothetical protein
MLVFNTRPGTLLGSTSTYSTSEVFARTEGATSGATSSRTSLTRSETTVRTGSSAVGSRFEQVVMGTIRSTRRTGTAPQQTFSQTFSAGTTSVDNSGLTTRSGTSSGSTSFSASFFTRTYQRGTTSTETYEDATSVAGSMVASRYTTTTGALSTTNATGTTTTMVPSTALVDSSASAPVLGTGATRTVTVETTTAGDTENVTFAFGTTSVWPVVYSEGRPCHSLRLINLPITGLTPLCDLPTANSTVLTPSVFTWVTNATTTDTTSSSSSGLTVTQGSSRSQGVTRLYTRLPDGSIGPMTYFPNEIPVVNVPRLQRLFQSANSYGTFAPAGTSWTILVEAGVTGMESSLRAMASIFEREEGGVLLVNTINSNDTLQLLGPTVMTLNVPIEQGPIANPGGGFADPPGPATVFWVPGLFLVTTINFSNSGSFSISQSTSSSQTLDGGLHLALRSVPVILPSVTTYASPPSQNTNFTTLSVPAESRTGVPIFEALVSECQQTWPDFGEGELD